MARDCKTEHEEIRSGRTTLISIGRQRDELSEEPDLILYNCPHCGTTLAHYETPFTPPDDEETAQDRFDRAVDLEIDIMKEDDRGL